MSLETDQIVSKAIESDVEFDPIENHVNSEYKYGFVTEIETESAPKGLNEDIVRFISAKKN
ncbi:MAG TPA: Fe-S cluster assembly protein SufB, partial [Niabella sp.]|nr:Fe-S cluster assembly protein SufB [Niabella sp.]